MRRVMSMLQAEVAWNAEVIVFTVFAGDKLVFFKDFGRVSMTSSSIFEM